jgi:hypothetical protein
VLSAARRAPGETTLETRETFAYGAARHDSND